MKKLLLLSVCLGMASLIHAQGTENSTPQGEVTKKVKVVKVINGQTIVEEYEVKGDAPVMIMEEGSAGDGSTRVIVKEIEGGEPGMIQMDMEGMDEEVRKMMEAQGLNPDEMKGKAIIRTVEVVNGDTIINEMREGDPGEIHMIDGQGGVWINDQGEEIKLDGSGEGSRNVIIQMDIDEKAGEGENTQVKRICVITVADVTPEEFSEVCLSRQAEKELKLKEIAFSPNPNDGRFNLSFQTRNKKQPVEIRIADVHCREVYRETFTGEQFSKDLDLSGEPAGTYFITLTQDDEQAVKKIVITR